MGTNSSHIPTATQQHCSHHHTLPAVVYETNVMSFFFLIQWPERIYQSLHGVTAVDFSIGTPNLLAVGYHNGTIAVYNVQSNVNVPVLDSR